MDKFKKQLISIRQTRAFTSLGFGMLALMFMGVAMMSSSFVGNFNESTTSSPIGVASTVVHLLVSMVS